jgi:Tfp pilus assembly protein PilO
MTVPWQECLRVVVAVAVVVVVVVTGGWNLNLAPHCQRACQARYQMASSDKQ